jgi:hypothetical protein
MGQNGPIKFNGQNETDPFVRHAHCQHQIRITTTTRLAGDDK